jgi:ubiquinone/menaquinone biosynthesis C-methylase UbiE
MSFFEIYKKCLLNLNEYELWPSYFKRRYLEFISIYETMPQRKFENTLELGCGIGYYSAFLSTISINVIATDLEQEDGLTHSPGLDKTRIFLKKLEVVNVHVEHASAEKLPYPDNSFDLVFSSHVLEHVPNRNIAIEEINRVLKPKGINVCIVPTRMDRFYAFFLNFIYLTKRIFARIVPRAKKKQVHNLQLATNIIFEKSPYIKSFPFPPAHGAYPSFFKEFDQWSFSKWEKLITKNNTYTLISSSSAQINPLLPLLSVIFPRLSVKIHEKTRKVELNLGRSFFKRIGISGIFITKK